MKTTSPIPQNIEEYIASFPTEMQKLLNQINEIIKKNAPEAVGQISYRMAAYKLNKKVLIYFAGFNDHIGVYPRTRGLEEAFAEELNPYSSGKGTIKFPLNEPLDSSLLERIVQFRVRENISGSR